jgi:hypothetical protein
MEDGCGVARAVLKPMDVWQASLSWVCQSHPDVSARFSMKVQQVSTSDANEGATQ